uniref:diaminopimelate decarboxylase family protein n=1 Tax=Dietzia sp. TaxID=1871616 RepID=UPI002FD916A7
MSAHPAGPRHEYPHAPSIGERPADANELMRLDEAVWPKNATRNPDTGAVEIAGCDVNELAAEYGTPLFVVDEDDFRSRCRELAEAFGGGDRVHYASKAFLCTETARWIKEEGLALDVASGGELAIALRAGFPTERITMHGNNKSVAELELAARSSVGHIVLDAPDEIALLDDIAAENGTVQDVFLRVTVGVEAHTHEFIATAHEDQKFGFSLAGGKALDAVGAVLAAENLRFTGLHSHIGSQIFEFDGFELAARRVIGLMAEVRDAYGLEALADVDTVDLGGGLGISYTTEDNPPAVSELAQKLLENVAKQAAEF